VQQREEARGEHDGVSKVDLHSIKLPTRN
jgi:hypothetical protein